MVMCPSCGSKLKKDSSFCQECGTEIKVNGTTDNLTKVTTEDEYIGFIQIISVIEIALGILIGIIGIIVFLFGLLVTEEAFKAEFSHIFFDYIKIIVILVGILFILFGFLSIYFGVKLYQLAQIGRIGSMVIAALNLMNIPFGTLFGIATLILLVRPEAVVLFRKKV